jgi:hypothetical protein
MSHAMGEFLSRIESRALNSFLANKHEQIDEIKGLGLPVEPHLFASPKEVLKYPDRYFSTDSEKVYYICFQPSKERLWNVDRTQALQYIEKHKDTYDELYITSNNEVLGGNIVIEADGSFKAEFLIGEDHNYLSSGKTLPDISYVNNGYGKQGNWEVYHRDTVSNINVSLKQIIAEAINMIIPLRNRLTYVEVVWMQQGGPYFTKAFVDEYHKEY